MIWLGYLRICYQFYEQIYSNISKNNFKNKIQTTSCLRLTGHILEVYSSIWYWPERALFMKKGHFLCRKDTFLEKSTPPPLFLLPYSIPFLNALHWNKAFHKRRQHSIVRRNKGLEYALTKYDSKDANKFN